MAGRKPARTRTRQPARSAAGKAPEGFTDEERAAMRERAQELKSAARRGSRAGGADGERDVLEKIAEMPARDRAMAARLHAVIRASAPAGISNEISFTAVMAPKRLVKWSRRTDDALRVCMRIL